MEEPQNNIGYRAEEAKEFPKEVWLEMMGNKAAEITRDRESQGEARKGRL